MKSLLRLLVAPAAFVIALFGAMTTVAQAQCPAAGLGYQNVTALPAPGSGITGFITVTNPYIYRDGVQTRPHGFNMIAFVASIYQQTQVAPNSVFVTAYNNFLSNGAAELSYFKNTANGNTARFQVSQPGIDSINADGLNQYNQTFCNNFVAAVELARSMSITVIISMQNESQSGGSNTVWPTAATTSNWQMLAKLFKNDKGVMFEMYNEPQAAESAQAWATWHTDFTNIASAIRAVSAPNVLVADGLNYAQTLQNLGSNHLSDTSVVYASHPYFQTTTSQQQTTWQTNWGYLAATYPVLITEWTTVAGPSSSPNSGTPGEYYCVDETEVPEADTTAQAGFNLVSYIFTTKIGITAYAFDFSGTKFGSAYEGGGTAPTATSWANNPTCMPGTGYGPGATLSAWFLHPLQAPVLY